MGVRVSACDFAHVQNLTSVHTNPPPHTHTHTHTCRFLAVANDEELNRFFLMRTKSVIFGGGTLPHIHAAYVVHGRYNPGVLDGQEDGYALDPATALSTLVSVGAKVDDGLRDHVDVLYVISRHYCGHTRPFIWH